MAPFSIAFKPYDPAGEEFATFKQRFESFVVLNDLVVDPEKQRALLLSTLDSQVLHRLECLVAPRKVNEKTVVALLDVLQEHFQPARSVIVERCEFYRRSQKNGEPPLVFVAEVRKLAARCNFGPAMDEMIRDRIVSGLVSEELQRRLLVEGNALTLKKTVDIITGAETAARGTEELRAKTIKSEPVDAVRQTRFRERRSPDKKTQLDRKCYRCHGCHLVKDCRLPRDVRCWNCDSTGHIERACPNKSSGPDPSRGNLRDTSPAKKTIQKTNAIEIEDEIGGCFNIYDGFGGGLRRSFWIAGKRCPFDLDTGTATSVINRATWIKVGRPRLQPVQQPLRDYSGYKIDVLGQAYMNVKPSPSADPVKIRVLVVRGRKKNLLGLRDIRLLNIDLTKQLQPRQEKLIRRDDRPKFNRRVCREEGGEKSLRAAVSRLINLGRSLQRRIDSIDWTQDNAPTYDNRKTDASAIADYDNADYDNADYDNADYDLDCDCDPCDSIKSESGPVRNGASPGRYYSPRRSSI